MVEHNLQDSFLELIRTSKNKLKGGINKMDIKSRYEVIADLEEKKRDLIIQRDNLDRNLIMLERELLELNRNVEDKKLEIKEYKDSMKLNKETTKELIKSVDASLDRLTKLGGHAK